MPKPITPIAELRVVSGFRCGRPSCTCVHFVCPGCGDEASVDGRTEHNPIFPVECEEERDGDPYLVDARVLRVGRPDGKRAS